MTQSDATFRDRTALIEAMDTAVETIAVLPETELLISMLYFLSALDTQFYINEGTGKGPEAAPIVKGTLEYIYAIVGARLRTGCWLTGETAND